VSSRRNLLLKTSPHRGTGKFIEYLRCPCCGKLARGQAIGHAGTHKLSVSRCVGRQPGYRTGFDWKHEPPSREHLTALRESLAAALNQVNDLLEAELVPGLLETRPALADVLDSLVAAPPRQAGVLDSLVAAPPRQAGVVTEEANPGASSVGLVRTKTKAGVV